MTPLESLLKSCSRCWLEQSSGALTQSCPLPIDRKFRRCKLLPPAPEKLLWFQERRNPFSLPQEKGALMKVHSRLTGIQEHQLLHGSASWQLPYTAICGFPATLHAALLFHIPEASLTYSSIQKWFITFSHFLVPIYITTFVIEVPLLIQWPFLEFPVPTS